MALSRRDFGRLALTAIPAAAVIGKNESWLSAFAQAKPNSLINGVQVGTITYSYHGMPDRAPKPRSSTSLARASARSIHGRPGRAFAGAPAPAGRGGGPGGPGGGRRGAAAGPIDPKALPPGAKIGEWQGHQCIVPADGGDPLAPGAGRGGGGARGRGQTPEQQAAQQEAAQRLRAWRTSVSMDPFKKLRSMFNDAGVTIYAWKQLNPNMSNEKFEYVINVAETTSSTHTTLELPAGPDAAAQLKRIGDFALNKKIYAAYHTHAQGGMSVLDEAFAASKGNMANVDLGHWVAGGNKGGTPMDFLMKYHDRTASFHLKDRTTPEHCALNLPWGSGETPITQILQLVKKNKWKMPAAVELEYDVPEGSDAVQEVKKCLDYCHKALA
jgi:sugar phosphate isomerase/epimerase